MALRRTSWRLIPSALVLAASVTLAAVTPEEAEKLGGPELTPIGAERAGNRDGTIPAWTGGLTTPPPHYRPDRHHADPYADDEPLFTITAENAARFAEDLSEGQKSLFRLYPQTWRMRVYPSRRSAAYPAWVYEAVKANARSAELRTEGKGGVLHARVSSPFPIPKSALEVLWNHNLRWRGIRVQRAEGLAAVTRRGNYTLVLREQDVGFAYGVPGETPFTRKYPNLLLAAKDKFVEPAFVAGDGLLVIEPIDQTREPRMVWSYLFELRRIVRAPYFAYGSPAPHTDSLRTVDDFDLYNGAPDRYDWELLGKRELYVPYNAYRLHSGDLNFGDLLQKGHINPELCRYERHRVWVVEGRLKPGAQHVYSRRVFYVDEDSWQIAASDSYDLAGDLWRTAEAHAVNYYQVPVLWSTLQVFYDLREQRYLVEGLDNHRKPYRFLEEADPREFSPNALRYYIR